jgi:hypothetical protein
LNSLHENFFEKKQAIESLCDGRECGREIYRTDTPTKEILKDTYE